MGVGALRGLLAWVLRVRTRSGTVLHRPRGLSRSGVVAADRETCYQISQGSQVIAYDIFLNLEVANSQELFRSDTNSERYGLIPQVANPRTNPDALPIGMSKTVVNEGRWKGEYVGLTCAACHVAQLAYKGKRIRIDGGVNNI